MNLRFRKLATEQEGIQDPFTLSVLGEREVSLIPCRRVLTYGEESIRVETVGCVVSVKGAGLSLKAYYDKEVRISGEIDGVSIERSGRG